MSTAAFSIRNLCIRLWFHNNVAQAIVDDQVIDEINKFKILTYDDIENIWKVICRPVGMIPNPEAVITVPVDADAKPANITKSDNKIYYFYNEIFKLSVYFVKYQERVSRANLPADVTLDVSRGIRETK